MKESLINENSNYIESIESTSIENIDAFYFSQGDHIPIRIKDDFKKYQNFLLIFVNPKSGSHQGLTVLDHIKKYKVDTIPNYNIISFPVNAQDSSQIKPPQELNDKNNINNIDNINNDLNTKPAAKFDPLVSFSIIVFNIIDKEEMTKGKKFIKKYLSDFPDFKIKILIAGGDGTVLGIVEELNREKVDLNRCIFGAMPFGTGNDLSNALGFGTECQVGDINNFQRVLYTYIIGVESKIDIWELSIKMDQLNGAIYDVVKDGEKNRCCNKVVYAIEGAKRIFCCKKNYGLTQLLDSFLEGKTSSEIINTSNDNNNNMNIITEKSPDSDIEEVPNDPLLEEKEKINIENDNTDEKRFVFKTKTNDKKDIVLKGNPVSLVCQNIDFYMGGTRDIWGKTSHLGIHQEEASKADYQEYKRQVVDNFKKQAFDDKQIEFFTFENGIEFGLERVARGLAKRVYQGPGPVYLEFKKDPDETEKVALTKVYINCDGEFYHLQNPKEICVRLNENICNGQINILRNIKGL